MEGDVSAAVSFQIPVLRIMDYPISHDPFSSPSPLPLAARDAAEAATAAAAAAVDSSDVALMGNLLTDMLSSDFPYGSSRYSVPDILQFPADQASKITLLQMLEDSQTTSSPYNHLKLPVLLEEPPDQKVLVISSTQQQQQQLASPTVAESFHKECKPEPDPIPVLPSDQQASSNEFATTNASPIANVSEQIRMAATASANSENSSEKLVPIAATTSAGGVSQSSSGTDTQQKRPKRKRIKSCKNTEEVESQRQTHIAVERNRRKQMNEHLNVLRSLMPGSYVQRGDQASIIGGAIEFVKELEQLLQCLQAQKRRRMYSEAFSPKPSPTVTSMLQQQPCLLPPYSPQAADSKFVNDNFYDPVKEVLAEAKSEVADIEVKMMGSDAVVKILSQRRPGQLLKTISAIESMCMTIVHTNITTIEQTVLYSFTVKLGMECRLAVEEIAEGIQRAYSVIHGNSSAAI